MRSCIGVFILMSFLFSCTYEKAEVPEVVAVDTTFVCDTADVTYTKDIQPLLLLHCGTDNECHRAIDNQSDVPLDTYELDTLFAGTGQLLNSITSQNGNPPAMPKEGDKLTECDVNKIKAWINQGMKQ